MFQVIVAGCGGISNPWLQHAVARADTQIVALVNPTLAKAEAQREKFGLDCPVFGDVDIALNQVPGANLLFDLTPPAQHCQVVTSALRHGLHVFGEKPLSDSMEDARKMIRVADENGRSYFLLQNRRYLHGMQTLKQLLTGRVAGTPGYVAVDVLMGARFTGFRNQMQHPFLIDMSIHTLDQARCLLGDAKAVSAYCQEHNPPGSWYAGAAAADCIFEMDDGTVLSLRGSWASRSENTPNNGRWRVACAEGTLCWDGANRVWVNDARPVQEGRGYYEEEGLCREVALDTEGREGHDGCLDDMFAALREGRSMQTDCHNNVHSLAMSHACLESAATGRKVLLKG